MQNRDKSMDNYRQAIGFYWQVLRSNRWWILIPAICLFSISVVVSAGLPNVYSATAVMMAKTINPVGKYVRPMVSSKVNDIMRAANQQLYSQTLLRPLIRDLNPYPEILKNPDDEAQMQEAVAEFASNLLVKADPRRLTISVSFSHSLGDDPAAFAARAANEITERFLTQHRGEVLQESEKLMTFLVGKEAERLNELVEAEEQLAKFREENVGRLPEDRASNIAKRERLFAEIRDLNDQKQRNSEEIDQYKVAAFELREKLKQAGEQIGGGDQIADLVREHIANLEGQLVETLTRFTEESDHVGALRLQIKEARSRLEQMEREVAAGGSGETAAEAMYKMLIDMNTARQATIRRSDELCDKRLEQAKRGIAEVEENLKHSILITKRYTELQRDVDDALRQRERLREKAEDAVFSVDVTEESEQLPIKQEQFAYVSKTPSGPPRVIMAVAGLMIGLALGIGIVILRTILDNSLRRADDLRLLLPGTVMVTIPEVMPNSLRAGRMASGLLLGLVLAFVFVASVLVLVIRQGLWGDPEMIRPLVELSRMLPI